MFVVTNELFSRKMLHFKIMLCWLSNILITCSHYSLLNACIPTHFDYLICLGTERSSRATVVTLLEIKLLCALNVLEKCSITVVVRAVSNT